MRIAVCPACKKEGRVEKDSDGKILILEGKYLDGRVMKFTRCLCGNPNCYRYGTWIADTVLD